MFGIGFTEILLISIIAILFLGPDKLPETMVQIAKFIKGVKKTVGDAKGALEEEMKISELKEEALSYKKQLDSATSELKGFKNIDLDDILDNDNEAAKSTVKSASVQESEPKVEVEQKSENVTLKKRAQKIEKSKDKGLENTEETSMTKTFKTDIESKKGDN